LEEVSFWRHFRSRADAGGLIVSDIEAAHHELVRRGIDASEMWHGAPLPRRRGLAGPTRNAGATLRVVLLFQGSPRQYAAGPGGYEATPRLA
jgi:hypothetical protein